MVALERSRPGLAIDAPLDVCTLLVVEIGPVSAFFAFLGCVLFYHTCDGVAVVASGTNEY